MTEEGQERRPEQDYYDAPENLLRQRADARFKTLLGTEPDAPNFNIVAKELIADVAALAIKRSAAAGERP